MYALVDHANDNGAGYCGLCQKVTGEPDNLVEAVAEQLRAFMKAGWIYRIYEAETCAPVAAAATPTRALPLIREVVQVIVPK
eukprot:COSAG02_NODE_135_length_34565_cov_80.368856_29_plen_82_part_00